MTEEKLQSVPGQARACLDGGSKDEPNQNCWPGGVDEAGTIGSKYEKTEYPKLKEMFGFYFGKFFRIEHMMKILKRLGWKSKLTK